MTTQEIAKLLHGIQYPVRIPKDVIDLAKLHGLVIVHGLSDDLVNFVGAINDDAGAYGGKTVLVDSRGLLPTWHDVDTEDEGREYFARKKRARTIEAIWNDGEDYSWQYETDIPHATFDVCDEGTLYCRGLVFRLADAEKPVSAVSVQPLERSMRRYQRDAMDWCAECVGRERATDTVQRNYRFLEEALELVQACHLEKEEAHALVDYVYGRGAGNRFQEAGGVMLVLATLCEAQSPPIDLGRAMATELARVKDPRVMNRVRIKQATKPMRKECDDHG